MRASQLFGLDRLKAIIRALSTPGAVEIAWKSSIALVIAAAVMVGVAVYLPPAQPPLDYGVRICKEDAAGLCQPLKQVVGEAGDLLDAGQARIDHVWVRFGAAKYGPGAARGGESVALRCSETLSLPTKPILPPPGEKASCPVDQAADAPGRPLHAVSVAIFGTNHYRLQMTCTFADGAVLAVEDGAACKSANRQPLTGLRLELRQNYFSILQDAGCKFAGLGCAPGIETGRFGPNRKIALPTEAKSS
ncbi:hypothetical protein OAN80_05635 [Alphaproteobacteria bacterium]|nr:hypothetical protein [Alphaproteobacteria bacterium]